MGTIEHTPDATQGAAIETAGVIVLPDDTENVKADNIQLGDQQLADWMAFRTGGPANDVNFKITGNGTPPAGGYTSTTNPLVLKGTPLVLDGKDLDVSGGGEFTSDNIGACTYTDVQTVQSDVIMSGSAARHQGRTLTLNAAMAAITITGTADVIRLHNPSNATTDLNLDAVSGITGVFSIRIIVSGVGAGKVVNINRVSDSLNIVSLTPVGASKHYGITVDYSGGRWVLGNVSGDEAFTYGTPT